MRFVEKTIALLTVLICLFVTSAFGKSLPKMEVVPVKTDTGSVGQIKINGKLVASIQTPNGDLSPVDRAQIGVQRLQGIVQTQPAPWKVSSGTVNGRICVVCGDQTVLIISKQEATAHATTRQALADLWADSINKILSVPAFVVKSKHLIIPIGESRSLTTSGYLDTPISVSDQFSQITRSEVVKGTRSIRIQGLQAGRGLVTLRCESEEETISIEVKKYAGTLGTPPIKVITGRPAPEWLIKQVVHEAIAQCAQAEPGANYKVASMNGISDLSAGGEEAVDVKVEFSGDDYLPSVSHGTVRVQNLMLKKEDVATLLYSNSPERISKYQTLFAGKTLPEKTARLFYHHQNVMGRSVQFRIDLQNPSENPAQIQVVDGSTDPLIDTVLVGFRGAKSYFDSSISDVGRIYEIPAHGSRCILDQELPRRHTTSGIFNLRQLSGDPLSVRVWVAPEEGQSGGNAEVQDFSSSVFPNPTKVIQADYTVGGHWAFIRIGKTPIRGGENQTLALDGNYGVLYRIEINTSNTTNLRKKIEVRFEATAGRSRAIFFHNGERILIRETNAPNEEPIFSFWLEPGESRKTTLETMPLGGSSYPATVIVKSS